MHGWCSSQGTRVGSGGEQKMKSSRVIAVREMDTFGSEEDLGCLDVVVCMRDMHLVHQSSQSQERGDEEPQPMTVAREACRRTSCAYCIGWL